MGGGLRIGTFAGAAVILDWSVALLAGYVILRALDAEGAAGLPSALTWLGAIFASILMHEFAHAAMAAWFKLPSRRIVLTFFGGHVEFVHPPKKRWHDIAVSAAGPLANLAGFAVVYAAMAALAGQPSGEERRLFLSVFPPLAPPLMLPADWMDAPILLGFFSTFMQINLLLGVFNLLPGFPLDGGRILSSSLAYVMHPARARMAAGAMGVLVAIGLGYNGYQNGFVLSLVVAAMLLLAALAEIAFARRALAGER